MLRLNFKTILRVAATSALFFLSPETAAVSAAVVRPERDSKDLAPPPLKQYYVDPDVGISASSADAEQNRFDPAESAVYKKMATDYMALALQKATDDQKEVGQLLKNALKNFKKAMRLNPADLTINALRDDTRNFLGTVYFNLSVKKADPVAKKMYLHKSAKFLKTLNITKPMMFELVERRGFELAQLGKASIEKALEKNQTSANALPYLKTGLEDTFIAINDYNELLRFQFTRRIQILMKRAHAYFHVGLGYYFIAKYQTDADKKFKSLHQSLGMLKLSLNDNLLAAMYADNPLISSYIGSAYYFQGMIYHLYSQVHDKEKNLSLAKDFFKKALDEFNKPFYIEENSTFNTQDIQEKRAYCQKFLSMPAAKDAKDAAAAENAESSSEDNHFYKKAVIGSIFGTAVVTRLLIKLLDKKPKKTIEEEKVGAKTGKVKVHEWNNKKNVQPQGCCGRNNNE